MDRGHSQRSGHGEAPKAEAKVLDFPLSKSSPYLTTFRLSFISHEMEVISTPGGERTQQQMATTGPSTVLGRR